MTRERRIVRYEVPVNDEWCAFLLPKGDIVHVACLQTYIIELWVIDGGDGWVKRTFRTFRTGQPLPPEAAHHIGTVFDGGLIWHLMESRR